MAMKDKIFKDIAQLHKDVGSYGNGRVR